MSQTTLAGLHVQLGQGDRPHLGLRDQPALGPALGEDVVGVAEAREAASAAAAASGRPGLRFRIITLSGSNSMPCDLGQLALRDALVGAAEVLADVGAEVVEAAGEQLAGDAGRVVRLAGEQADRLGDADAVEHVVERLRRQVGQVRFLPASP